MGIFKRKPIVCTVCNKETTHKHKPKREWGMSGPLCGDCYVDKMKEFYESKIRQKCVSCGIKKNVPDLWEPRWQWDMTGLLCKECFDNKEKDFNDAKNFCTVCGKKMGFIRYNPKSKWGLTGQLCRICWDEQKAKNG